MASITTTLTAVFQEPALAPAIALERWRSSPPQWLPNKYQEVDDSYNSVTWEWRRTGFLTPGATVYRLTALFDDDGSGGARVTVNGQADDKTRQAIAAAAVQVFDGGLV
jgi:hypothetical protein